jgi:hypothetical protein
VNRTVESEADACSWSTTRCVVEDAIDPETLTAPFEVHECLTDLG